MNKKLKTYKMKQVWSLFRNRTRGLAWDYKTARKRQQTNRIINQNNLFRKGNRTNQIKLRLYRIKIKIQHKRIYICW